MLRHLGGTYGSENVEWINVTPVSPGRTSSLRKLRDEFTSEPFRATLLPIWLIPIAGFLEWRLAPIVMFFYMLLRFGRGRNTLFFVEMVRSAWPFIFYKKIFSIPLIVDIHGTQDEVVQSAPRNLKTSLQYAEAVFFESRVMSESDGIVAVSTRMLDALKSRYGYLPPHSAVVPSSANSSSFSWAEERRNRVREELGVKDRFVFVYSGGTDSWQCIDETLSIFDHIRKSDHFKNLDVMLLLLVWNKAFSAEERCSRLNIAYNHIVQRALPQHEVSGYLNACDAGFLLRRNITTNLVASPTKAGEYLLSGLPIICTPFVGDISQLVQQHDVGYQIDIDGATEMTSLSSWCARVRSERNEFARRAIATGKAHFNESQYRRVSELIEAVTSHRSAST